MEKINECIKTKCNRCNSVVSFKEEDISSDEYYCACLECDEDLFKFETYEEKEH
jgi:late competence protein required for DNA uptake (superfamily II DNA/RNA helicase)